MLHLIYGSKESVCELQFPCECSCSGEDTHTLTYLSVKQIQSGSHGSGVGFTLALYIVFLSQSYLSIEATGHPQIPEITSLWKSIKGESDPRLQLIPAVIALFSHTGTQVQGLIYATTMISSTIQWLLV